jgi:AcrR family transcriptional regulator
MAVSSPRPGAPSTTPPRSSPSRTPIAPSRGRRRPDQLSGGRHGLTADEVAASQRARIAQAMTGTVGEHGYHGVRVADVVWRAGVSRKTFYELFAGKDDCFAATYDQWITWLLEVAFDAFDTQREWADRLRAALTALTGALGRDHDVARLCCVEALAAGGAAARRRQDASLELARLFDAAEGPEGPLKVALRAGRVSELNETLRREVAEGRGDRLADIVPELMCSMVLPFLGMEAAQRELARGQGRRG